MKKKNQKKKTKIYQVKTKPIKEKIKKEKPVREKKPKNPLWIMTMVILVFLVLLLFAGYYYVIKNYTVTTVYVEGNVHYSNEEIMDMVMDGYYGDNSLFLSMKYKDKSIEDVPFVEKMDISVLDPHTIKIEVYEKALAGYVEYLERYMYFDKDGIIVETSTEKTKGIPLVTGLSFDHVILYQPLPVENDEIFSDILSITQLVNKYDLSIDRIYFGADDSLTLYFEEVKVSLGNEGNLEEKIMELQYMLPELDGKKGTLRMENYTEETKTITFEPD